MPLHTPYDGSSKLFAIGIKPLDPAEWVEGGDHLPAQLSEKRRIHATYPSQTFVAEPDTDAAQREVLNMLADHLPARFPAIYERQGETMLIKPTEDRIALNGSRSSLLTAAHMVAEDLVILRRSPEGWRLVTAALAFPSSWVLAEKFGRPMHEIHAPVPGFGAGTRPAQLIERMFDAMRPETPMIRWNWSLYGDDRLYHPDVSGPDIRRFGDDMANIFLRVERQTLRRLPISGDIAFTIGIHVDPLRALERQPDAGRIAGALAAQLLALDPEQLDYKGLTLERDRLVERLASVGTDTPT